MANINRKDALQTITNRSDIIFAVAILVILAVMIVPLPFFVLDVLLAFNLFMSLVILLLVVYTVKPLEFSSFPTMLLLITLYRLALNVASTRLILLNGSNFDGRIIRAFGSFVVGGNYVVGAVIFLILIIIQFIVITKGAQRVAEVAARFTLDAMPGKQMAIDADLNAGLIDEKEAIERRKEITNEADFYGAMDGASKFIRGDAIAGIIITVINILGGFIIGVVQFKMTLPQSLQTYGLLTIGDGLVTQIPALLISTAGGFIVTRTRADEESGLGQVLIGDLLAKPKAIMVACGALVLFGLVPGFPKIPFFVLAGLVWLLGQNVSQKFEQTRVKEVEKEEKRKERKKPPEVVEDLLQIDSMELEIGYGLISLVDASQGGDLLDRITTVRRQCATELGIIVPPIRIRDNMKLEFNEYVIKMRGISVAAGKVMPDYLLAMSPDGKVGTLAGIKTTEPAFGLPAVWITENQKEKAESLGYTIVNAVSVVTTHLMHIVKTHAHEILGRQETKNLLDNLKKTYSAVVEEVVPNILTVGGVQKVLQNLLKEGIPVRDLVTILEVLGDYGTRTKDIDVLTEYVRHALSRYISQIHQDAKGKIKALTLDPNLEELLNSSIKRSGDISYIALEPRMMQTIIDKTAKEIERNSRDGVMPVILCSPQIRVYFKRMVERIFPHLAVLSFSEIEPNVALESVGMVEVAM